MTNMVEEEYNEDHDQISLLFDDLLVWIISKLTTRESVATSTLSKRWIKVLSSVNCQELDGEDGLLLHVLQEMWLRTDLNKYNLIIVLRRHGNIINHIKSGVRKKVELNLGLRSLSIYGMLNIYLTQPVFNTSALVELKLHRVCNGEILFTASLPSLKTLSHVRFWFENKSVFHSLLSVASRVLEELQIWYLFSLIWDRGFEPFLVFSVSFYTRYLGRCLSCWLGFHLSLQPLKLLQW